MKLITLPHPKKSERLTLRIVPQSKRLIEQAAALEHLTLTEFILRTVIEKAEKAITEHHPFPSDEEQWEKLCKVLEHPA